MNRVQLILNLIGLGCLLGFSLNACNQTDEIDTLPTKFVISSWTPSSTPSPSAIATKTASSTATHTSSPTQTPSSTFTPTFSTTPSATFTITATSTATLPKVRISYQGQVNLRSGPSINYETIEQAEYGNEFSLQAYTVNNLGDLWYLVQNQNGEKRWVSNMASEIDTNFNLANIAPAATIPPTPTLVPTITLTPARGLEADLQHVPILSDIGAMSPLIYELAQDFDRDPHMLAKVGDCNTFSYAFLRPLDTGNYWLGRYDYLQESVLFFRGTFARESAAGQVGFNIVTVQDSLMADPNYCLSNESPLACEYRRSNASVAVIMFGSNDVLFIGPKTYDRYLRQLVEYSIISGVIPILTTFTRRPDNLWTRTLELNMVIVDVAKDYGIPLINFWLAARYLPGNGISPDNAHLNQGGLALRFDGDETYWGHTLRSLLTLQMLDKLRHEIPIE